jgi:hypothetical protein
MLGIPPAHLADIAAARSARELQPYLQGALELKMIVIPPYLTALFSLRDGNNGEVRETLGSAVVDEMLHVALIANTMNAVGCPPILSAERLARGYPARLPLGATGVELGLTKFSLDLTRDVFLALDGSASSVAASLRPVAGVGPYATPGGFYRAIIRKFEELGDPVVIGDPALQFVDEVSYSQRELFRIHDARSAIRALRLVSGDASTTGEAQIDSGGSARFRRLKHIARGPGADASPFDPSGVINIVENSRTSMYPPGSLVRNAVDQFNVAYCSILAALHETFNGRPDRYEFAISRMYGLTSLARSIVATDLGDGTFAAPSFQWRP